MSKNKGKKKTGRQGCGGRQDGNTEGKDNGREKQTK